MKKTFVNDAFDYNSFVKDLEEEHKTLKDLLKEREEFIKKKLEAADKKMDQLSDIA